jgi:hypothetical protein
MENSAGSGPSSSVPAHLVAFENVGTHQGTNQILDLHRGSVSSPDLQIQPLLPASDVSVSRTRTLPLRPPKRSPTIVPTLQGVTFDVENLERLRRWVLGLAIGNCCSLVQPCTLCLFLTSVDFDLEQGPSLTCIFPLFPLYPFEAENMFVLFSARVC